MSRLSLKNKFQEGGRDLNSTYYSLPHYALKIKDYG